MQAAKYGITRPAKVQHMADGGFVKSIRSMFGSGPQETVTEKYARQDAELKAKMDAREPKEQAPTMAPLVRGALDPKNALRRREAEAGLAKGGAVRKDMAKGGDIPGKSPTSTADNIPIQATAGEFMIRKSAADVIGPKVLRALNALGGGKEANPAAAKGRGAIRKMAQGGFTDEEERKRLISQIPTGGAPGAGPTPGNGNSVDSTEFGRNVSNTINALGGVVPGLTAARGLMGATRLGAAAEGVGMAATRAGPYAAPAAGLGALQVASSPAEQPQQAAQRPIAAIAQQQASALPAASKPVQGELGALDPLPSAQPPGMLPVSGVQGREVGPGINRYDIPGKSPLFSNLTGPEGQRSNEALVNRGAVTAQNQGAMDGIQARQDATQQGRANQAQYDSEVASANAANQYEADKTLREAALGRPSYRGSKAIRPSRVAQVMLEQNQRARNEETGFGITRRGQDIDAARNAASQQNAAASQKLAQDKFDLEKDGAKLDNQAKEQLAGLQSVALDPNATPDQRKSALATYRALTGKSETQNRYTVFSLPDEVVDGQVVRGGQAVIDNTTGQRLQQQGAGSAIPTVGEVKGGYKFKGGNPADQKNWEKV